VKNEKTVTIQKILIVEDDKISLSLTTKILRKISQEIIHAQTGIEAIEQFRHNSEVDLVLMDIGLPGIGGYEAARQIRRYNRDVIIIAQSAGYPPIELSQAGEMVFNDYVNKPIDYQQLIAIIQKHCIKQK
jgi:CheY-like chemotaxis protein